MCLLLLNTVNYLHIFPVYLTSSHYKSFREVKLCHVSLLCLQGVVFRTGSHWKMNVHIWQQRLQGICYPLTVLAIYYRVPLPT